MIRVVRTSYKDIRDFFDREWSESDLEHYGRKVDWKKHKIILKAVQDGKTLGVVKIRMEAGVADIQSIVVAQTARRKGIGKALMNAAEAAAKKAGCHFMELVTGKNWKAVGFYEALGYKKVQLVRNYYHHQDFFWFTKEI